MFLLIFSFYTIMMIIMLVYFLPFLFSNKNNMTATMSSLEAGFFSTGNVYKMFSIQFFLLLVIFVIFDLEMLFLLGILSNKVSMLNGLVFLLFLLMTFWVEWSWSKMTWMT